MVEPQDAAGVWLGLRHELELDNGGARLVVLDEGGVAAPHDSARGRHVRARGEHLLGGGGGGEEGERGGLVNKATAPTTTC